MSASKYTPELGALICERISAGETLRPICEDPGMPCKATVMNWRALNPEFRALYEEACRDRVEAYAEELIEIADDAASEGIETQAAKLRIDTRKWVMSKLLPKKYGDKLDLNHSGSVANGSGLDVSKLPIEMQDAILAALDAENHAGEAPEG